MKTREYYVEELNKLLSDEDLTDEKLREASERLLPNIADFLNKTKFSKKWCIQVRVDNYALLQDWSGIIDLHYNVFLFNDKSWHHKNCGKKEISTKKFKKINSL